MNHYIKYDNHRRRMLHLHWNSPDPIHAAFHLTDRPWAAFSRALNWDAYSKAYNELQFGRVIRVRATIHLTEPVTMAVQAVRFERSPVPVDALLVRPVGYASDCPKPGSDDTIREWFSLARSVAAGRAPIQALSGFMEDRLNDPWTALATDSPLELFERLYPEGGLR